MKYLVTGATGFLGAHVARRLEERGDEVVRFSRRAGGDVLDRAAVARAASGCDGAFHCAGRVSRKREDAEEMYRVHVEGTRAALDACEVAGVRRVVVASTSGTVAVGEDGGHVATETDPDPLSIVARWPYYRAKLFAEHAALAPRKGPLDVVALNPSLLLGPGDTNGSSTSDVRLFLEGGVKAAPAGGLSFVDVRDAAEAMCLVMEKGRTRERYLVGACNLTLREFLERLSRVSGVAPPRLGIPRSTRFARLGASLAERAAATLGATAPIDPTAFEMAQYFWYVDASKACVDLGWAPRDPNVTLYDTVEDLRARGVVWPRPSDGLPG